MSWFKKANPVPRAKDPIDGKPIEAQLNEVALLAYHYCISKSTGNQGIPEFVFLDPYTNVDRAIPMNLDYKPGGRLSEYVLKYDQIIVYPHNIPHKDLNNEQNRKQYITNVKARVLHELNHAIDKKYKKDNKSKSIEKMEELKKKKKDMSEDEWLYQYHTAPIEFDAKCRDIIETLRYLIQENPQIEKDLKIWVNTKDYSFPSFLEFANFIDPVFKRWMEFDKKRKGNLMRTFKKRVYSELFGATKAPDLLKQKAKEKEIQKGQNNERN